MNDSNLTKRELKRMVRQIKGQGWKEASLELFERQPALAERLSNHFAMVRRLMQRNVRDSDVEKLMVILARLVVEPLLLLDRSHRKLWDDFLPTEQMEVTTKQAAIRTLAEVGWATKQVQSIRPDLPEAQSKTFLNDYEAQIIGAMERAGRAEMERLLKEGNRGGPSC